MCAIASGTLSVTRNRSRSVADTVPTVDHLPQQIRERLPVRRPHQHDRELQDLARLNQRQRFGQLVERAETAGQHDEGVRVLEEQHLAHEEVVAGDVAIEILVGKLLVRRA